MYLRFLILISWLAASALSIACMTWMTMTFERVPTFLGRWHGKPGWLLLGMLSGFCLFCGLRRPVKRYHLTLFLCVVPAMFSEFLGWRREIWIITGVCMTTLGFSIFYLGVKSQIQVFVAWLICTNIMGIFLYNGIALSQRSNFFTFGWTA
jgi:hypothetical protein